MVNAGECFREKIRSGRTCVGTVVSFSDPAVSEACAAAGCDFVWIDMEHQPIGIETAWGHVMALRGTETAALIRVPWNDPNVIKPILDLAPAGVIIPQVRDGKEAEQAVAACRYPPRGCRGFGPRRGMGYGTVPLDKYLADARREPMVFIQVEHIAAVRNVEAILRTDGLDGICIGPNDLSGSMGKLGRTTDPEVAEAMDAVLRAASGTGLMTGVATGYDPATLAAWIAKGVRWICLEGDWLHLCRGARATVEAVRAVDAGRGRP